MITGLGIDIIEIERIEKAIAKNARFLDKIFTVREKEMFQSKNMKVETIAGNFAAKEAVSKVLGSGVAGFRWTDIEILRETDGKPYVILHHGALERANERHIEKVEVSISHNRTSAIANAIGCSSFTIHHS